MDILRGPASPPMGEREGFMGEREGFMGDRAGFMGDRDPLCGDEVGENPSMLKLLGIKLLSKESNLGPLDYECAVLSTTLCTHCLL